MFEKIVKNLLEKNNLHKTIIIGIVIIINTILIIGIIYIINKKENDIDDYSEDLYINISIIDNSTDTNEIEENTEKIIIYITGEVNNPGVYELDLDSRITDAIEKAGGVTANANLENVNLAYKLSDGQKIKIPSIKDENNGNNIIANDEDVNIQDMNNKNEKININTASKSELTSLSGIGESTAQKIIDYRNENGNYKSIEDIKKVSGIGDSKYNQIKDYIKVK